MEKKIIGVVPIGKVPDMALKVIAAHILTILDSPTEILSGIEPPPAAFDKKRLQYDAGIILRFLESEDHYNSYKIVGVCNFDLFIPIFTHVYGEARQDGDYAIVSLFRLQKNSLSPDKDSLLYERMAKVALHEIGHLFHMIHCEDELCLMHYADELYRLDTIQMRFCRYCFTSFKNLSR